MPKLKKTLLSLLLAASYLLLATTPAHAQLSPWNSNCAYTTPDGDQVATIQGLECIAQNILAIFVSLIGLGLLIMIIYGAYQILLSGGDPKSVEAGRNTITFAIVGLIVGILAFFIINLIAQFTGATGILQFSTQV